MFDMHSAASFVGAPFSSLRTLDLATASLGPTAVVALTAADSPASAGKKRRLRPLAASLGEEEDGSNSPRKFENPRLPVPNEYLAGWALTQNDTACLQRFHDMGFTEPKFTPATSAQDVGGVGSSRNHLGGFRLWGEATKALMDRVDITRDLDQRRLAASRYWQVLQSQSSAQDPTESTVAGTGAPALSWADVNALFENDDDFVRRERELYLEEAAEGITSHGGWKADMFSRQWVASYRLSMFETRRQAQRFFSWGIPDEGALDCILEPGKRVLEVGSGLGYWAYMLKLRSGDDSRVRCFDLFSPTARRTQDATFPLTPTEGSGSIEDDTSSKEDALSPLDSQEQLRAFVEDEDAADEWFGEGMPPFMPAERGSSEQIAQQDPDEKFREWSLFICWPSDGRWPAACLEAFEGDDFFYVGEAEGGATRMPWRLMREEWELKRRVAIPNWPGFRDALWWYTRKSAAPSPLPDG